MKRTSSAPRQCAGGSGSQLLPLACALAFALYGQSLAAATIMVDSADDAITGDSCSLRGAIAAANTNAAVGGCAAGDGDDVIVFAAGIDAIMLTSANGGELTVTEHLTIDGGGELRTVSRRADDAPFRILQAMPGAALTLSWLKVTGGLADTSVVDRGGAGVLAWAPLSISHGEISGNLTSPQYGRGAGINAHETLELIDSRVTGNATTGPDARGGGIYAYADTVLRSSLISENATAGFGAFGGGIASYPGAAVTLERSTVTSNSTFGDGAFGGGIFAYGSLFLTDSTVSSNSTAGAQAPGGGGYAYQLTAMRSTISTNSTTGYGSSSGGFFIGNATISNSTVSGNMTSGDAAPGGALLVTTSLALANSTVTGNSTAGGTTGGIFVYAFDSIPLSLESTIVYGNVGDSSGDIAFLGTDAVQLVAGTHNLIGAVADNVDIPGDTLDCDPQLGHLTENGGPTLTHALAKGSCALDAGVAQSLDFDQRGEPFVRTFGAATDIGAVESQPALDVIFATGFE